jgi:TonB family protein
VIKSIQRKSREPCIFLRAKTGLPLRYFFKSWLTVNSSNSLRNVRVLVCGVLLAVALPLGISSQEAAEPKPLKKVLPAYPEVLRKMGISGTVRLKVTVAADGSVKDIEVQGGGAIFAEAASKAVRQWRYPAGSNNRVAEVSAEFECCNTVKTSP